MVEYGVDPPWSNQCDAIRQFWVVIVDGLRTHRPEGAVVACRRGADNSDARVACKLDECASHAAVGTENENGLTRVDLCLSQHLPCGDAVDQHGLGARRVEAIRNRYQVACVDQRMGRPSSGLDDRSDATTDQ